MHELLRDGASYESELLQIWLHVKSRKHQSPRLSVSHICERWAANNKARVEASPKHVRELLASTQKYLLNAQTLRRMYAQADALVKRDPLVRVYCDRELAKWCAECRSDS